MKNVQRRHAGECFLCGTHGPVDRHHLDWHHNHNEPSNVMSLCPRCHSALHKIGYMSREEIKAIRQKVKDKGPERFMKTFWDVLEIQASTTPPYQRKGD